MSGTVELAIRGMTCNGCASALTRVLSRVAGVNRAQVELASGRALIEGAAREEDLVRAVEAAGYQVEACSPSSSPSPE
jgi:copper chaperone